MPPDPADTVGLDDYDRQLIADMDGGHPVYDAPPDSPVDTDKPR